MKTFAYRGFNEAGRHTKGLVEAIDVKEARERLAAQGIMPEKLLPAGTKPGGLRRRGFGLGDRALIYRELAALLHAGIPLDQALELLLETPELGRCAEVLAKVRDAVRDGDALAAALSESSRRITLFETALLETGERTGALDAALVRLADFLEEEDSIRERIRTAMIYPAFIILLALVVSVLLLGVMMPNFEKLLGEMQLDLPPITRVMLGLGGFLARFGWVVLAGLGLLAWMAWRGFTGSALWQARWARAQFGLPVWGKVTTALVNLRFSRTLALLLQGGVPLEEGLPLAGRSTGNTWVETGIETEAEKLRQGSSLADAVRRVPALSGALPGWIRAGEASGDLPELLESAARRFQRDWEKRMTRALSLLEPIVILVVGLFVLLVAMAVLQPILSMNEILAP